MKIHNIAHSTTKLRNERVRNEASKNENIGWTVSVDCVDCGVPSVER